MEAPTICPRCHGTRIVHILWANSVPWREKQAVQNGQAILASDKLPENAPSWACLTCKPGWETVHKLAIEREELFDKTIRAVADQDFDEAYRLKDIRVPIEARQWELISELCRGSVRMQ